MKQQSSKTQNILDFIQSLEGLKTELRHSWLSRGRRESVAEHTWRMAMMAMVLAPELTSSINLSRTIEIILVHDIPEILAGDRAAWKKENPNKHEEEKESLLKLTQILPKQTQEKIMSLWLEFEENKTPEAQLAHALDKLEALIQHNQANIKTWKKSEREFSLHFGDEFCQFDKTIKTLKDIVRMDTAEKIKE